MKRILLVCTAGMSTSLLVEKMQEAAKQLELDAKIWAVGQPAAAENIEEADIVLLGPQISHKKKQIQALAGQKPVMTIDIEDYGTMNGVTVLDEALALLHEQSASD